MLSFKMLKEAREIMVRTSSLHLQIESEHYVTLVTVSVPHFGAV